MLRIQLLSFPPRGNTRTVISKADDPTPTAAERTVGFQTFHRLPKHRARCSSSRDLRRTNTAIISQYFIFIP
jgi:hypothetical protein